MKHTYKKGLWCPWLCILFLLPHATGAPNLSNSYRTLKGKYQEITIFKANLECEIAITESSSYRMKGMIATKPPEKWTIYLTAEQEKGKHKLMLLDMYDGKTQWTYKPKKAALESNTRKQEAKNKPTRKFFPAFELYDEKTLILIKEDSSHRIFQMASIKPSSFFYYIRLQVNTKTMLVEMMEFLDVKKKVRISVTFSNIKSIGAIDDSVFSPTAEEKDDHKKLVSRLESLKEKNDEE